MLETGLINLGRNLQTHIKIAGQNNEEEEYKTLLILY